MKKQSLFILTDEYGTTGVFTTVVRVLDKASKYVDGQMYFYNLDGKTKITATTKTLKEVLSKTNGITLFKGNSSNEWEICNIFKRSLNE